MLKLLVFTLLYIVTIPTFAQVQTAVRKDISLSTTEKDLLRKWNSSINTMGSVIGMAPLRQNEDTAFIQKQIEQIIDNLGKEEFNIKPRQIIVHLYGNPIPNAFVAKIDEAHIQENSEILKKLYPKLDPKKPVYEIGITLGLWNKLSSVDEVAFILGHELSHLFEGHVDQKTYGNYHDVEKIWWSSHRHEAIADYKGMRLMIGKYNLQAAVRVLYKIHATSKVDSEFERDRFVDNIFEEALSSHHSAGLRISMAQVNAEEIIRSNFSAVPMTETPIPGHTIKYRYSEAPERPKKQTIEDLKNEGNILWDRVISQKIPLDYSDNILIPRDLMIDATDTQKGFPLNKQGFPTDDVIAVTRGLSERIWHSKSMTLTEKGNALWDVFSFYNEKMIYHRSNSEKSAKERQEFLYHEEYRKFWTYNLLKLINLGWTGNDLYKHILKSITTQNAESQGDDANLKENLFHAPARLHVNSAEHIFNHILVQPKGYEFLKNFYDSFLYHEGVLNYDFFKVLEGEIFLSRNCPERYRLFYRKYVESILLNEEFRNEFLLRIKKDPANILNHLRGLEFERKKYPGQTDFLIFVYREVRKQRMQYLLEIEGGNFTPEKFEYILSSIYAVQSTREERVKLKSIFSKVAEKFLNESFKGKLYFKDLEKLFSTFDFDKLSKEDRIVLLSFFNAIEKISIQYSKYKEQNKQKIKEATRSFSIEDFVHQIERSWPGIDNSINDIMNSNEFREIELELSKIDIKKLEKPDHDDVLFEYLYQNNIGLLNRFENHIFKPINVMLGIRFSIAANWLIYMSESGKLEQTKKDALPRILRALNSKLPAKHQIYNHPQFKYLFDASESSLADQNLNTEIVSSLFKLHLASSKYYTNLSEWVKILNTIHSLNAVAIDSIPEIKEQLEKVFIKMARANYSLAYKTLSMKSVRSILSSDSFVEIIMMEIKSQLDSEKSTERISSITEKINKKLKLQAQLPDVFAALREQIAIKYKAQPQNVEVLLPSNKITINTQSTSEFDSEVRGLSMMSFLAQEMKISELIESIEYLMGRSESIPKTITDLQLRYKQPFVDLLRTMRIRLSRESHLMRAFTINTFLAGPRGHLENSQSRDQLIDHILKDAESNKDVLKELFISLLESQPLSKSLPIAYILGQNSKGKALSEGDMIRTAFEAFGAAGIKLGQYLAFTGEFKNYTDALDRLQDSAMPLSYLQAVRLLESRFGAQWNSKIKVIKVIGSGSVNVAIEVYNSSTRKREVISVLRKDIEVSALEDFRKLELFIKKYIERSGSTKYSYMLGLLRLIEESVKLEFNKQNAFTIQKVAVRLYDFKSGEWQFQSPRPNELNLDAKSIRMEKAPGKTAKHFEKNHPEVYKDVMSRFLKHELDILLGTHSTIKDVTFFGNPDIHNGQILIDTQSKKVTVLDFGQAIPITNQERLLGIELLTLMELGKDVASFKKYLFKIDKQYLNSAYFSDAEIQQFISKSDRMDKFVYLIGQLRSKGSNIPVSTVHWILGINRASKLGAKVGINIEPVLKGAILSNRLGLSTDTFNIVRKNVSKLLGFIQEKKSTLSDGVKSIFAPTPPQAKTCESLFR